MAQYFKLKAKHPMPSCFIALVTLWNFLAMMMPKTTDVLGIVLTLQQWRLWYATGGLPIPLWIFTYPNWSGAGYRVAICEQRKPSKKKGGGPRHHRCDHTRPGYCRFDARQKSQQLPRLDLLYQCQPARPGFHRYFYGRFVLTETDTEGLTKLMDGFQPSGVITPGLQGIQTNSLAVATIPMPLMTGSLATTLHGSAYSTPLRCKISRALG